MCDCTHAMGHNALIKFAGVYCEHPATSYCQKGVSTSEHAFCTNGGECKFMVGRKEEHAGCKCPNGYEGHYCQFVRGSKPSDWDLADFMHPALVNAYGGTQNGGSGAGGVIAIIIGSCAGFILLVGILSGYLYCGTLKSKLSRNEKEMDSANAGTDDSGVVLGGRSSSVAASSFVGGQSVYKKKNTTSHFVTADNLEADGGVLQDAMMEDGAPSMEEVDLDDAPNNGELA